MKPARFYSQSRSNTQRASTSLPSALTLHRCETASDGAKSFEHLPTTTGSTEGLNTSWLKELGAPTSRWCLQTERRVGVSAQMGVRLPERRHGLPIFRNKYLAIAYSTRHTPGLAWGRQCPFAQGVLTTESCSVLLFLAPRSNERLKSPATKGPLSQPGWQSPPLLLPQGPSRRTSHGTAQPASVPGQLLIQVFSLHPIFFVSESRN